MSEPTDDRRPMAKRLSELLKDCRKDQLHPETDFGEDFGRERRLYKVDENWPAPTCG